MFPNFWSVKQQNLWKKSLVVPIMFLEQRNQRTGFIYLEEKIILFEYGFHICGGFIIMLTNKRVPFKKRRRKGFRVQLLHLPYVEHIHL
jgi:hypothetical protein